MINAYLDSQIDASIYQQTHKKRQKEIRLEIETPIDADETCLLTIKTVVDLA